VAINAVRRSLWRTCLPSTSTTWTLRPRTRVSPSYVMKSSTSAVTRPFRSSLFNASRTSGDSTCDDVISAGKEG
jgi:hypothetical protein